MHPSPSRIFSAGLLSLFLFASASPAHAATTLMQRVAGHILLQVEQRGEAWYVDPVSKKRFSLGNADQAYALMRTQGLGIRHAELTRYLAGTFPTRLAGRIVLDVESRGEAYYVSPQTRTATYLATAADAYTLMRQVGLGITNASLSHIPIHPRSPSVPLTPPSAEAVATPPAPRSPFFEIEQATWRNINAYRQSKQLPPLIWNETVAAVARTHSTDMATERVGFSHDGFDARYETLNRQLPLGWMAENIDAITYEDPAVAAVRAWIDSPGHRENIENPRFTHTGVGVAQSEHDEYFLTQLFVSLR